MMQAQPPEQMPQGQQAPQGAPQAGGDPSEALMPLINGIGDGLLKFQGILSKGQGQIPPEFEQRLGAIVEEYKSLVTDLSTGAQPGQAPQAQSPRGGAPVSMEGGANGVPRL
jgi:hypothetical protein